MRNSNVIWLILYFLMLAAIVVGFRRGRQFALARYGSDSAQASWEDWREDVRRTKAKKDSPTERRIPKSQRPPMLVLMEDYYASCMVFSMVLSTALFLTTMFVAKGAMRPTVIRDE